MPSTEIEVYALPAEEFTAAVDRLFTLGEKIIAPTRAPRGDVFFREVESREQMMLESFGNSEISPAEHIRPSKEVYFSYELRPGEPPVMTPPPPVEPFVIFGIRPCDVSAICALDHFFLERNPRDDLYARRRRAATLIALACTEPAAETCFCPCCEGGGPVAEEGFDVQLSKVGEWYIVEIASEKGERIRNLWKSLLEPATEEMLEQRAEQEEQCIEQMFSNNANIGAAVRRVSAGKVEPETWNEIAEHCYSCGACSFICPVCTCFDVNDVDLGDKRGVRVRQVDSCRTFGYPREAAGGVRGFPTAARARMYANHKLSYDHYRERGRYGCVGCGRCVVACLGHMGMPTIARLVRKGPTAKQEGQETQA